VADTVNTRLGVGISAPLATFHISSGGADPLFRITDTTATARDVVNIADGGATTLRNQADSAAALQVQTAGGNEVFTVDTSASNVALGKKGTSGVNGSLVFNTTNASNTAITISAASTATSYSLTLPTTGPSISQCLRSNASTASQLEFGTCGGTLAASYNSSATTGNAIALSSGGGGIIVQDASSTVGSLFTVQNNTGTANYLNVTNSTITIEDSGATHRTAISIDITNHELKVFSADGTTNYASVTADNTSATFKANSGITKIGNGTGAITLNAGSGAAVNITGHATSVWQTDAGSLTIQGGTTLSLLSTTSNAISVDSGSTGGVNVGAGANAKVGVFLLAILI
jgi:hypothetical protein